MTTLHLSGCRVTVDLEAVRLNLAAIQRLCGAHTSVIAVVKANAYGCGAVPCGRTLWDAGASMLAVTRLEEAVALREALPQAQVMLLAPLPPGSEPAAVELGLTCCVSSAADAIRLNAAALSQGTRAKAHLKFDTGMARFGFTRREATTISGLLGPLENLDVTGAYTHFANASAREPGPTQAALADFLAIRESLGALGSKWTWHAANSAALLRFPETRLDAVRPGTLLYGQFPGGAATGGMNLHEPFAVSAPIVAIRDLEAGTPVGYGSQWKAKRASRIAIVACGYADGLALEPRARPETPWGAARDGLLRAARLLRDGRAGRRVTVRGQKVPLVGRIAMQTCAIDVTEVPDAQLGDLVTLPMRRVTTSPLLPRVYVNETAEDPASP